MPLKLSLYHPRVKVNDLIAKQRIGESERIKINLLIQSLDIVFITFKSKQRLMLRLLGHLCDQIFSLATNFSHVVARLVPKIS